MTNNRIVFLDYLRAIACFMVIMVHACELFYFDLSGISFKSEADRWWIPLIDSAIRSCVPLFVMASSYLLLSLKDDNVLHFFRRRFVRVLVPFLVWAFLYTVLPLVWGGYTWSESVDRMILLLYNFPINAIHLWFIYMLIGLVLIYAHIVAMAQTGKPS